MNRLPNRLIFVFAVATLAPLLATAWISVSLLDPNFSSAATVELDQVSKSLEKTGRELYQRTRESLRQDASLGRVAPERYVSAGKSQWPSSVQEFFASSEPNHFGLNGDQGDQMDYLVRHGDEVWVYSTSLHGVKMNQISEQYAGARALVAAGGDRGRRRGFL